MIERYIEPLSTYASDIDDLIFMIGVMVIFWFFLFLIRTLVLSTFRP